MFRPVMKPEKKIAKKASQEPMLEFLAKFEEGEGRTPQTFSEALREQPRSSDDFLEYMRSIQR